MATSQEGGGAGFRLNVLNPGGNDPEQHFDRPASAPHAPVNFHAYAACTGGSFLRDTARAIALKRPVLLLLRGDFRESERALRKLKKASLPVAVSLKETGLQQIAEQLNDEKRLKRFVQIVQEADGCISPTAEAAEVYRTIRAHAGAVAFIPAPYPLHDPRWDFSAPSERRAGIFIGTREWKIPSRNHAAALFAARKISEATGETITVYNVERRRGQRLLASLGFRDAQLKVIEGESGYEDYLRALARHKLVFQLDSSFVPGQVAGDCLLARMPCVGGNGTLERIAFPELCGGQRSAGELIDIAIQLMGDASVYQEAVTGSQQRAGERLSFAGRARDLAAFFAPIASAKTL